MIMDHSFLDAWSLKATWTIKEAALLVNEFDPLTATVEIDPKSASPVSRVYYWLTKEYKKGALWPLVGSEDDARFSPGTLMRRLNERGLHVSKRLSDAYERRGKITGPHKMNLECVIVYRQAAKMIWENYPGLSRESVAQILTALPSHIKNQPLPGRSMATIRRYLKGFSPNKPGRPPKKAKPEQTVDLAAIAEKMGPGNWS